MQVAREKLFKPIKCEVEGYTKSHKMWGMLIFFNWTSKQLGYISQLLSQTPNLPSPRVPTCVLISFLSVQSCQLHLHPAKLLCHLCWDAQKKHIFQADYIKLHFRNLIKVALSCSIAFWHKLKKIEFHQVCK